MKLSYHIIYCPIRPIELISPYQLFLYVFLLIDQPVFLYSQRRLHLLRPTHPLSLKNLFPIELPVY